MSRQEYMRIHGSEEFHKQDVEITRRMLEENRFNCVIDCGLGSMTSSLQEYLRQYCFKNPVIYVLRDMEQIRALLNLGDRSARLLEAGDPSHRRCSNFEYFNLQEPVTETQTPEAADRASPTYSFKLRRAQEDFAHYVRLITGSASERAVSVSSFSVEVPLQDRAFTHALEIPLSVSGSIVNFEELHATGDAVEILVDQWVHGSPSSVTKLVAMARRYIKVPIIYSLKLSDLQKESQLSAISHGFRLGVEYLSVDLSKDMDTLQTIVGLRGGTKIIGTSKQNPGSKGWKDPTLQATFEKAVQLKCSMARFVFPASSMKDLSALNWFKEEMSQSAHPLPVIAYNTDEKGRTSQLLNSTLTPVTHMSLQQGTGPAAMASLTAKAAVRALFDCFVLDPLKFCIVGANVTQSLSPAMHNAAYEYLGLQHTYTTRNIQSWSDIETLARDNHFGGASVVQPWKVKAVGNISSFSHHAKAIGAVNTLMPLRSDAEGGIMSLKEQALARNRAGPVVAWHGENTDWLGISVCISRNLSPRNTMQPRSTSLVIGAGGMARAAVYALIQMRCRNIFVHNRTVANANSMADHFNQWIKQNHSEHDNDFGQVRVLESRDQPWPEPFTMPTIIVSCVTHEMLDGKPGSDFEVPIQWLQSPSGGVVVELAYMTKYTALIKQMRDFREKNALPWVIVDGISALVEQAMGQFEIMTGRKAPRKAMTAATHVALSETRHLPIRHSTRQGTGQLLHHGLEKRRHSSPEDLAVPEEKLNAVDIVTQTDNDVEEFIHSAITKAYPTHHFIGEETYSKGTTSKEYLITSAPTWIVDPLDGTVNFTHGFPMFCVSIALAVNGHPVIGVIYAPLLNQLFSACKGQGAWLNETTRLPILGQALGPLPPDAPKKCILGCEWGKDRRDQPDSNLHRKVESFVNMAAEIGGRGGKGGMVHGVRSLGSATMDLAYTAMGSFDIRWEGGCWEWDVAAGICLLEEAGGLVTTANPPEGWEAEGRKIETAKLGGRLYLAIRPATDARDGSETGRQSQERVVRGMEEGNKAGLSETRSE
ncbi:hypothetical protein DV736_g6047, partial [Chaetothyriales sp. CBS 134916]